MTGFDVVAAVTEFHVFSAEVVEGGRRFSSVKVTAELGAARSLANGWQNVIRSRSYPVRRNRAEFTVPKNVLVHTRLRIFRFAIALPVEVRFVSEIYDDPGQYVIKTRALVP